MSITAGELQQIRAEVERLTMPATCTIITPATGGTLNPDGSPKGDGTPAVPITSICRWVDTLTSASEVLRSMRITGTVSALLYVPIGTVLRTGIEQVVYNGDKYTVIGTNSGQSFATSLAAALRFSK